MGRCFFLICYVVCVCCAFNILCFEYSANLMVLLAAGCWLRHNDNDSTAARLTDGGAVVDDDDDVYSFTTEVKE